MRQIGKALRQLFGSDRGLRLLVVLGLVGIALITLPTLLPAGRARAPAESAASPSAEEVERALEQRICALLDGVEGVGTCRVMVTLERGVQLVYAADRTLSSGTGGTGGSERLLTVSTDGGTAALPVTELQPAVRGVAVVCAGGGDPAVVERVTRLITAAFDLSARRVCVEKGQ